MRDANLTTTSTQNLISTLNTFTAPRTLTLPGRGALSSYYVQFADTANAINGANVLNIQMADGGLINGGATLSIVNAGSYVFIVPNSSGYFASIIHGGGSTDTPGGTSGQIQYNSSGIFGGFTASGDAAINTASGVMTLTTVNANVGAFGSNVNCTTTTYNAKGLVTAASQTPCTPAVGSITGLGTGIATALAVNVGSAGAPVLFNGAGGTPSSIALTNATGLPLGAITGFGTGVATSLAVNIGAAGAPVLFDGAGGTPSSMVGTNITGTAAGLTAGNVTTNANLTGDITSVGNATTLVTVNANVGTFGDASNCVTITTNAKGLITAASQTACAGGGGAPGGSTTQVQYNNAGAFAGITGATTNGTTLTLVAPVLGTPASLTLTNATGLPNASVIGLGTAAVVNTGTSGATIPLLNGTNTWSNLQTGTAWRATGGSFATGTMYVSAAGGLNITGVTGSSFDFNFLNPAGSGFISVPTGTVDVEFGGATRPVVTVVASLPTCNFSRRGYTYTVSDATAPAYNATVAGGGAVVVPVVCNGANWTAH
jgi:hypothetical protein